MSRETTNLKLFKYDPTQDQESTFNIDTALNENWDKIDEELKKVSDKANTKEVIIVRNVTISKNNWKTISENVYSYDIQNNNITFNDSTEVNFSFSDIFDGRTDGIMSVTQSFNNSCQIYSSKIPSTDLYATMVIQKGE